MKKDKANLRTGPGKRYPVTTVFNAKMPLLIIDEYGYWRRVRDFQGEEGWVHKFLLSSKRLAITTAPMTVMYKTQSSESGIRAKLKQNVIVKLEKCISKWCYIRINSIAKSGYVKRTHLFGILEKEKYNP